MMIVVAGSVRIRPEHREAAVRAALAMAEATRREAGCRTYRFSADLADSALFYIHEEWDSAEALALHFATPHMAEFNSRIPGFLAGAPEITRFEVSAAGPLA
jgi:quinol monooxygenase YgiN